jgi:hypothetical protein
MRNRKLSLERLESRECKATFYTDVDTVPGVERIDTTQDSVFITSLVDGATKSFRGLGRFNNINFSNLNAVAGDEIILTHRSTLNGIPTNDRTVTVISAAQQTSRVFDVGRWSNMVASEFNGDVGVDLAFHNGSPNFVGDRVTTLMRTLGTLQTVSYDSLPFFNTVEVVDLDGTTGNELLLTKRQTINGTSANGMIVSIVNPRAAASRSYDVGSWTNSIFGEVNGSVGTDVVFHNANFGRNRVSVLASTAGTVKLTSYSPKEVFNAVQLVNLDAIPGDEILLTFNATFFNNGSIVTVVSPAQSSLRSFDVGPWTGVVVGEMNGEGGMDLAFHNGRTGSNRLTLLMSRSGTLAKTSWELLPLFNNVVMQDLDGQPGNELLLTMRSTINGINNNNRTVSVITPRSLQLTTYNVGPWSSYEFINVDGVAGMEVVFFGPNQSRKTINHRLRRVN